MKKYCMLLFMVGILVAAVACKPPASTVTYQIDAADVSPEESVADDLQEMEELDQQLDDLEMIDLEELERLELE